MGFMDSYKYLEKLCADIFGNDRPVSSYIDAMESLPRGAYFVTGWNDDLKTLRHYRWIRNKISHEPDCTEENMTSLEDVRWLDEFYQRIMNQTDPLALYRRATQHNSFSQKPVVSERKEEYTLRKPEGCLPGLLCVLLVIANIIVWHFLLK